jgi:hypothetical protein
METIAKILLVLGGLFLLLGGLAYLAARAGLFDRLPLGRLPGDLNWQVGGVSCFIPLATSCLLSVALTILLNVIARLLSR